MSRRHHYGDVWDRAQSYAPRLESRYSKYYNYDIFDIFWSERDEIFRLIDRSDLLLTDPTTRNLDRVDQIQDLIFVKFHDLKKSAKVNPSLQSRLFFISKAIDKNREKYLLCRSHAKSSKSTPVSKPTSMTSKCEITELEHKLIQLQAKKQDILAKRVKDEKTSQENWKQYHVALAEEAQQLESGNFVNSFSSNHSDCSLTSSSSYDLPDWDSDSDNSLDQPPPTFCDDQFSSVHDDNVSDQELLDSSLGETNHSDMLIPPPEEFQDPGTPPCLPLFSSPPLLSSSCDRNSLEFITSSETSERIDSDIVDTEKAFDQNVISDLFNCDSVKGNESSKFVSLLMPEPEIVVHNYQPDHNSLNHTFVPDAHTDACYDVTVNVVLDQGNSEVSENPELVQTVVSPMTADDSLDPDSSLLSSSRDSFQQVISDVGPFHASMDIVNPTPDATSDETDQDIKICESARVSSFTTLDIEPTSTVTYDMIDPDITVIESAQFLSLTTFDIKPTPTYDMIDPEITVSEPVQMLSSITDLSSLKLNQVSTSATDTPQTSSVILGSTRSSLLNSTQISTSDQDPNIVSTRIVPDAFVDTEAYENLQFQQSSSNESSVNIGSSMLNKGTNPPTKVQINSDHHNHGLHIKYHTIIGEQKLDCLQPRHLRHKWRERSLLTSERW